MNSTAKLYIAAVCTAGLAALSWAAVQIHIVDFGLFGLLSLLALVAAGLKLKLPGIDGNISLSFVPLVLSAVVLTTPEAIVITLLSAAAQVTVFAKSFRALKAAFNCAALVVSIACAGLTADLVPSAQLAAIQLVLAGGVYYLANTALVTAVIGLAEGKPWGAIWADCCRLYLPYFAAGMACAVVALTGSPLQAESGLSEGADGRRALQFPGLVVLPVMLLTRYYFKNLRRATTV